MDKTAKPGRAPVLRVSKIEYERGFCYEAVFDVQKRAIEWYMDGADVHFTFDGVYLGLLNFAGTIDKVDNLPASESMAYGTVFYCEETQAFHPNIPDKLLESMPEE